MQAHRRTRSRAHAFPSLLVFAALGSLPVAATEYESPSVQAAATSQAAPAVDSIARILQTRIERGGAVGIVAGIAESGTTRMSSAGYRTAGGPAPVDEETVFEIGSVSKVFTTTLLAEMVVRGEVALDDPVARYLPDSVRMPSFEGHQITLLDLATQSSGLPRMPGNFAPADPTNPYADYGVEQLYTFLSSYTPERAPGAAFEYSNLGMGLLGHVLARRAGKPYEALVTERILEPLGMSDTRIALDAALQARLATGHNAGLEPVPGWDLDVLAGAGAWRSTMSDMMRFAAAAAAPPPNALGEALKMAMEPRAEAGAPGVRIGLAWHVIERGDRRIVLHNGQTGGHHAFVGINPENGTGVVLLANSATNIDDIGIHLLDPAVPVNHPAPPRATVAVDDAVLESYVGRYEFAPQFHVVVSREGDALYAQATDQPRFRLHAASPTRFFLREVEAEVEFTTDAAGAVTGMVLHQGGRASPGRRVEP